MVIYQRILILTEFILQSQAHKIQLLGANQIRIASSKTNADLAVPVFVATVASTTDKFRIISRVSDKKPNDAGHPIQYDTSAGQWFVHTSATGNTIQSNLVH